MEPYTIMAGLPAKPIRDRCPDLLKQKMLYLAWWDWDHQTLRDRLEDFRHLKAEDFVSKYS